MIEAILWLTINLYHEARGEPVEAQIAVVHVCLYRAGWKPENVRSVILKRKQFTWTSDRRKRSEAKQLVREGRVPDRMKSLVSVVYRALSVPFYERPKLSHYQVPGSSNTWTCWPGGITTVTFPGSGHVFCGDVDVVRPGKIPEYIKKCAKRRVWQKKKEKRIEIGGC